MGVICAVEETSFIRLSQQDAFAPKDWEYILSWADIANFCPLIPKLPDTVKELGSRPGGSLMHDPEWLTEALSVLRLNYKSDISFELGGERALDGLWFSLVNACLLSTPFRATAGEIESTATKIIINGAIVNRQKFDARIIPNKTALEKGMSLIELGYVEIARPRDKRDSARTKICNDSEKMVKSMIISLLHSGGFVRASLMICGLELRLIEVIRARADMYFVRFRRPVSLPLQYSPDHARRVLVEVARFVWLIEHCNEDLHGEDWQSVG